MTDTPRKISSIHYQRSETIHEIVSSKPGTLVQWGNLLFLVILLTIGISSWFIRYPDIINASAKLTSLNGPRQVINLVPGKLVKLSVTENQSVNKGQILGYLESTGSHEEILLLSSNLDSIQKAIYEQRPDLIKKYFKEPCTQLGELQVSYEIFTQSFLLFENYLSDGFFLKKRNMLLKDKSNLSELYKNLLEQKELYEQDYILVQKTFEANESLKNENVISDFDYRIEQSKLINKKLILPQIRSSIVSNMSQQVEKQKEIIELDNAIYQQKLLFQQSLNTFKNRIDEWKKKYILTAPVSGKIAFSSFIQLDQQLQVNQILFFVNPKNSQYFAEIEIPQVNFGKVKIGQKVLMKFQSYPFQEYGSVNGEIEFISQLASENGYLARVVLPNGLLTTYNIQIQYHDGLLANAEIITSDLRLLQRFYYSLVKKAGN